MISVAILCDTVECCILNCVKSLRYGDFVLHFVRTIAYILCLKLMWTTISFTVICNLHDMKLYFWRILDGKNFYKKTTKIYLEQRTQVLNYCSWLWINSDRGNPDLMNSCAGENQVSCPCAIHNHMRIGKILDEFSDAWSEEKLRVFWIACQRSVVGLFLEVSHHPASEHKCTAW